MKTSDQTSDHVARCHKTALIALTVLMPIVLFFGYVEHRSAWAESHDVQIQCRASTRSHEQNTLNWLNENLSSADERGCTVTLEDVTFATTVFWSFQAAIAPENLDFIPIYSYPLPSDGSQLHLSIENLTRGLRTENFLGGPDWYVGIARNFSNDGNDVWRALPLSDQDVRDAVVGLQSESSGGSDSNPLYIVSSKPIPGVEEDRRLWVSENKKQLWAPAFARAER